MPDPAREQTQPDVRAALRSVVSSRDAAAVRAFLEQRPDARAHIDAPLFAFDTPALVQAASWGDAALVRALLDAGADPNRRTDWWAGPFHALHHAQGGVAQLLLDAGAVPDACAAASLDRIDMLGQMLDEQPARVHERGGDGQLPLHFARSRGVVDLLLARGADPDARDIDHRSTAAEWMLAGRRGAGRYDLARYLVECGATADIFLAAALGLTTRLEALLAAEPALAGLRTGQGHYGEMPPSSFHIYTWTIGQDVSPLRAAVQFGQQAAADLLVDVVSRDSAILAAELAAAAGQGDADVVRKLLETRPDSARLRTAAGDTPLHYAAEQGHLDVVRLLVEAGADVDDEGDDHQLGVLGKATCLHHVHRDVADYLLAHGARMTIFPAISLGRIDDVRSLVEAEPAVLEQRMNGGDMDLRTPVHHAVDVGDAAVLEVLLRAGGDPNTPNSDGARPASYVRSGEQRQAILDLLLRYGAEPDDVLTLLLLRRFEEAETLFSADPALLDSAADRPTPLHLAVSRADEEAVRWLIGHGADVNAVREMGACGVTPLHVAVTADAPALVTLLLEAGADHTARDTRWNADPLGWADHHGARRVRALLAAAAGG